jgi:hypothetical protein
MERVDRLNSDNICDMLLESIGNIKFSVAIMCRVNQMENLLDTCVRFLIDHGGEK